MPSRWSRIDWATGGAVVGVVAGIGTLLFTGIATYYGARVSAEQLDQSRQDAEREARGQASRISYWVDDVGVPLEWRLHIVNRSPDPVSQVKVLVLPDKGQKGNSSRLVWSTLAPCTEVVVKASAIGDTNKETFSIPAMAFLDRDGVQWKRTLDFLKRSKKFPDTDVSLVILDTEEKPAEQCNDSVR
ncbi:hypothetical protein [Streptomyces sp. 2A115]|uniref:hypothetical protein n=1 Tax=Streptomyces sp. 2A115 TaxID=3457439 RepID=UPI003FD3B8A3